MTPTPDNGNFQRRDYRCPICGRLWFRAYFVIGTVLQIRCPKCGAFHVVGKNNMGMYLHEDANERKRDGIPQVS